MRVLLMIQKLHQGGGTETHVLTLATALKNKGHQVILYTGGGAWILHAKSLGIRVHEASHRLRYPGMAANALHQFLKTQPCDVIHAHDGFSMATVGELARRYPQLTRIVFTVHGHYVQNSVIRANAHQANHIIVVSPVLRAKVVQTCGVNPQKVVIIPNGIPTSVFHPKVITAYRRMYRIPTSSFVVGYAGRFTFDKLQNSLAISHLLQHLSQSTTSMHALIAGRNATHYIKSTSRVHVLGHVNQMQNVYNSCDVVIGSGQVALEALSTGRPVLVAGKSAYYGLVTPVNVRQIHRTNFGDHGVTHRLSTFALAADIHRAESDPRALLRNSAALRAYVKSHASASQMATRLLAVYRAR